MNTHTTNSRRFAHAGFAALILVSAPALAQVAPNLGTAGAFAVLGTNPIPTVGTVTCTDTGPGIGITGDVGTTFTSITNTGCSIIGAVVAPVPAQVVADYNAAFAAVPVQNPVCTGGVIPIVTTTLAPGVYCSDAGTTIPAGVTLTLNGTAADVWIFRVGTLVPGALTVDGQVVMAGGGNACNVYWRTSAAMTATDASFVGTVLSGAATTMTRTNWTGRAMASTDVTLTDPVPMEGCTASGVAGAFPRQVPTLSEWAMIMLAGLLALAGFGALRRQARQ